MKKIEHGWAKIGESLHLAKSLKCWHSGIDKLWSINKALSYNLKLPMFQVLDYWFLNSWSSNPKFVPPRPCIDVQAHTLNWSLLQKLVTYNLSCNLFELRQNSQVPTSKLLSFNLVDEQGSNFDLNKISRQVVGIGHISMFNIHCTMRGPKSLRYQT
jgi:hypothetical protein